MNVNSIGYFNLRIDGAYMSHAFSAYAKRGLGGQAKAHIMRTRERGLTHLSAYTLSPFLHVCYYIFTRKVLFIILCCFW